MTNTKKTVGTFLLMILISLEFYEVKIVRLYRGRFRYWLPTNYKRPHSASESTPPLELTFYTFEKGGYYLSRDLLSLGTPVIHSTEYSTSKAKAKKLRFSLNYSTIDTHWYPYLEKTGRSLGEFGNAYDDGKHMDLFTDHHQGKLQPVPDLIFFMIEAGNEKI